MGYVIFIIIAIAGALIGAFAGAIAAGYLVIFKSLEHIASISDPAQWNRFVEGVIVLLFTKAAVIAGAVAGGFFGSIPGIIGMAKCDADD